MRGKGGMRNAGCGMGSAESVKVKKKDIDQELSERNG